jgi:hypothetical protein
MMLGVFRLDPSRHDLGRGLRIPSCRGRTAVESTPTYTLLLATTSVRISQLFFAPMRLGVSSPPCDGFLSLVARPESILRRAAEFFQAFAAFVPGLGIEHADVAALVERQTGAGLAPEEDVLRGSLDGARRLPEPGGLVVTCGDDALAIGAERGGNHPI